MAFIAWPEIEAFHHIRKYVRIDPTEWWQAKEKFGGTSVVQYRCKVKLHGTNAAVQCQLDGTILPQSRTNLLSVEKDNAGFAAWVKKNEAAWQDTNDNARAQVIIYGEWCGGNIQQGVALSKVEKKVFAVFAARPLDSNNLPLEDILWVEPDILEDIVRGIPDTYVIPWYTRTVAHGSDTRVAATINVDWRKTDEELSQTIAPVNEWVADVEKCCPFVKDTFGIEGTGEGLVFYPVSPAHQGYEAFSYLCFKAKGEKHKSIATAKPAQVSAESAASLDAFVDLVLTPARLEQGATFVQSEPVVSTLTYDIKLTGKFVTWCLADVQKECTDEMAASNLTWDQVKQPLSTKARAWYLEQAKK